MDETSPNPNPLHEWELLPTPLPASPFPSDTIIDPDNGVTPDYFTLHTPSQSPPSTPSTPSVASWIDPSSDSRFGWPPEDDDRVGSEVGPVEEEKGREREKEKGWWRGVLEVLRLYVAKGRLVWGVSVLVGVVVLGRKLYGMRRRGGGAAVRVGGRVDGKRASEFVVGTARLSEAFSVVRRAPTVRTTLPTPRLTLWPTLAFT